MEYESYSIKLYSKDLDFNFESYTIDNPGPESVNGYIRPNTLYDFINKYQYYATAFDVKAYADELTRIYGVTQDVSHVEDKIIFMYNEAIMTRNLPVESRLTGYRKFYLHFVTSPNAENNTPGTTVSICYSRSDTLSPWHEIESGSVNSITWLVNEELLFKGLGEIILCVKDPNPDSQTFTDQFYTFGVVYNGLYLRHAGSISPDFPDYYDYTHSQMITKFNELNYTTQNSSNYNPQYLNSISSGLYFMYPGDFLDAVNDCKYDNAEGVGDTPDDDTSAGGGGDGDYSQTDGGDEIDFSQDPGLSGLGSGFCNCFCPTETQLQNLSQYMHDQSFISAVKKLYANPMDYIFGLKIVPFIPTTSGSYEVTVGGVSTGVYMNKVANRWKTIDCGSINIIERFGGYMDYNPYTKASIFLPYIGVKDLNVDEIMGTSSNPGRIQVVYKVDVITGECIAELKCKNKKGLNAVTYSFNGNCASDIPITQMDMSKVLSGFVGGASAGAVSAISASTGNVAGLVGGSIAGLNAIMQSKPQYSHSGNFSGNSGFLGQNIPYLIVESPIQSLSSNFKGQRGYPSNIGGTIGSFDGFTVFNSVRLHDIYSFTTSGQTTIINATATTEELTEIEEILKGGVYL